MNQLYNPSLDELPDDVLELYEEWHEIGYNSSWFVTGYKPCGLEDFFEWITCRSASVSDALILSPDEWLKCYNSEQATALSFARSLAAIIGDGANLAEVLETVKSIQRTVEQPLVGN